MRLILILFLMGFAAGCATFAPSTRQPLLVVITTEGSNNKVATEMEGETAVYNIESETGIGGAQVQLQSGEWPPAMILRFHLTGLEEMTLTYGEAATAVTLNISSHGDNEIHQTVNDAPISPDDPRWLTVIITNEDGSSGTIPLENGTIEVTLPKDFYEVAPTSFHINWIDFYR